MTEGNYLVRIGYHPRLGARPLRDAVERLFGDAVATDLLAGGCGCGELRLGDRAEGLRLRRREEDALTAVAVAGRGV